MRPSLTYMCVAKFIGAPFLIRIAYLEPLTNAEHNAKRTMFE